MFGRGQPSAWQVISCSSPSRTITSSGKLTIRGAPFIAEIKTKKKQKQKKRKEMNKIQFVLYTFYTSNLLVTSKQLAWLNRFLFFEVLRRQISARRSLIH